MVVDQIELNPEERGPPQQIGWLGPKAGLEHGKERWIDCVCPVSNVMFWAGVVTACPSVDMTSGTQHRSVCPVIMHLKWTSLCVLFRTAATPEVKTLLRVMWQNWFLCHCDRCTVMDCIGYVTDDAISAVEVTSTRELSPSWELNGHWTSERVLRSFQVY
jgi:hypothetical protein